MLTLGLSDLDAWWTLPDAELVDEPNLRYGGEMSVYRVRLADGEGHLHSLYIKRQCDQLRRSVTHPVHGEPTLVKEFRALVDCLKRGFRLPGRCSLRAAWGPTATITRCW
ncbi:hypothetical protein HML84_16305 [Alcanivorax sp. IO_7]|nr:hypothetical protein HML84_16305 [Alcanivorax sp. IO_7]